ncbi:hypothetical protein VKT23_011094 [Stygiomarasmius scandens]|uniref:Uncharacterized protein n=1 Tax=Marasmiellus scandens TaxID=2682957 RepID=A0ABR1J9X1_9AGAR
MNPNNIGVNDYSMITHPLSQSDGRPNKHSFSTSTCPSTHVLPRISQRPTTGGHISSDQRRNYPPQTVPSSGEDTTQVHGSSIRGNRQPTNLSLAPGLQYSSLQGLRHDNQLIVPASHPSIEGRIAYSTQVHDPQLQLQYISNGNQPQSSPYYQLAPNIYDPSHPIYADSTWSFSPQVGNVANGHQLQLPLPAYSGCDTYSDDYFFQSSELPVQPYMQWGYPPQISSQWSSPGSLNDRENGSTWNGGASFFLAYQVPHASFPPQQSFHQESHNRRAAQADAVNPTQTHDSQLQLQCMGNSDHSQMSRAFVSAETEYLTRPSSRSILPAGRPALSSSPETIYASLSRPFFQLPSARPLDSTRTEPQGANGTSNAPPTLQFIYEDPSSPSSTKKTPQAHRTSTKRRGKKIRKVSNQTLNIKKDGSVTPSSADVTGRGRRVRRT